MSFLSRRHFLLGAGAAALGGCTVSQPQPQVVTAVRDPIPPEYRAMYGPVFDNGFQIPAVDLTQVNPAYFRRQVPDPTGERPGTIVVDTTNYVLYLTEEGGTAMRYGVGLGREGFGWAGNATIRLKREWPTWTPPAEMIARQPELEEYRFGMEPGLANPLGARALYLFEGNVDTLYRLHGTMEAYSIGNAVSSGCVRLLNQDIIDLYNRTPLNAPVVVLAPGVSTAA
jgi:lipoprotein-anchoring transpeptidase ErfK/SrfK